MRSVYTLQSSRSSFKVGTFFFIAWWSLCRYFMLLSSIHHVISQHQQQISSLAEHQTVTLRTLPTAQSCVTKGPEPLNQLIDSDPLEPTSCNSLWIPSLSNQAQKTGRGASLSVILTNTQISKLQTTSKHQLWNETPTCFKLGWILGYSLWYLPYPRHRKALFWMGNINASHDAISSPRSFRLHGDWAQHCRTANRQWPSALGSSWMVTPRGKKATQWEQEWLRQHIWKSCDFKFKSYVYILSLLGLGVIYLDKHLMYKHMYHRMPGALWDA